MRKFKLALALFIASSTYGLAEQQFNPAFQNTPATQIIAGTGISIYPRSPCIGKCIINAIAGNGSVLDVAVATANGFAGTVANPTTHPVITVLFTAIAPNTFLGNPNASSGIPVPVAIGVFNDMVMHFTS